MIGNSKTHSTVQIIHVVFCDNSRPTHVFTLFPHIVTIGHLLRLPTAFYLLYLLSFKANYRLFTPSQIKVARVHRDNTRSLLVRGWSRLCLNAASLSAAKKASDFARIAAQASVAMATASEGAPDVFKPGPASAELTTTTSESERAMPQMAEVFAEMVELRAKAKTAQRILRDSRNRVFNRLVRASCAVPGRLFLRRRLWAWRGYRCAYVFGNRWAGSGNTPDAMLCCVHFLQTVGRSIRETRACMYFVCTQPTRLQ